MKESLEKSLFSALFKHSDHAYMALDDEGIIAGVSQSLTALTGHDEAELAGSGFDVLFADKQAAATILETTRTTLLLKNYESVISHADEAQERVFITARSLKKRGGFLIEITPAVEDLGATPDNSAIQETLVKMERFSAVGRITAAFAHEMRTPIHVIASTAELVLGDIPPGVAHRDNLEMILRNAEHANLSIRALLDFSKVGKSQLREGSINEVFERTLDLIGKIFEKEGIKVTVDFGAAPLILMDSQNMRAVVHSLLMNAVDSMARGGTLTVKTGISQKTSGAKFSVEDTGMGMSTEVLNRIGSAFFTTKENGTGLGLYLTKRVLAEHGAEITFASTEGSGTTVTVEFPKSASASPKK